jgi:hypothetical protein
MSSSSNETLLDKFFIHVKIGDVPVRVEIQIMSSYRTFIYFFYLRKPYTFDITKWKARGQAHMYSLFHSSIQRDASIFGSIQDEEFIISPEQRLEIVKTAAIDILSCLDQIVKKHQHSVVDYAIWYKERKKSKSTDYSRYITKITCDCIIQTSFIAENISFDLVEYQ